MDFVTIGMDAIVNQAAPMRYMLGGEVQVPVTYRCASGSGTGAAAQHCKALEAWFCHIPGLKVVAPGTAGAVSYTHLNRKFQNIRKSNTKKYSRNKKFRIYDSKQSNEVIGEQL